MLSQLSEMSIEGGVRKPKSVMKLLSMKERSSSFHGTFVEKMKLMRTAEDFNTFRLVYLNKIREELPDIFTDPRSIQILINLLQVCFMFEEANDLENRFENYFEYFFYAASFLITKLESPHMFNRLKVRACDNNLNLKVVYETERLIMNKVAWKIFLVTSADIEASLSKEFFYGDECYKNAKESVSDWINFSLNEYCIYSKYNQFTITIASIFISLKCAQMECQVGKLAEAIKIYDLGDLNEIEICMKAILQVMNKDDEEVEQVHEPEYNFDVQMNVLIEEELTTVGSTGLEIQDSYLPQTNHNSLNVQNLELVAVPPFKTNLNVIKESFDSKENQDPNNIIPTLKLEKKNSCKKKKKSFISLGKKTSSGSLASNGKQLILCDLVKTKKYRNLESDPKF